MKYGDVAVEQLGNLDGLIPYQMVEMYLSSQAQILTATDDEDNVGGVLCYTYREAECEILWLNVVDDAQEEVKLFLLSELLYRLQAFPEIHKLIVMVPENAKNFEETISFYESLKFSHGKDEGRYVKFSLDDFLKSFSVLIMGKHEKAIHSLREVLADPPMARLWKYMEENRWGISLSGLEKGLDKKCSMLWIEEGKIKGCVLIVRKKGEENLLNISYFYWNQLLPEVFAVMMKKAAEAARQKYGEGVMVETVITTPEGRGLAKRMLPKKETEVTHLYYMELAI